MGKRGQPQKPYHTSWNEHITGLYRGKDGRWRIVATGKRYTEPDERIGVKIFREWEAEQLGHEAVQMTMPADPSHPAQPILPTATIDGQSAPVDLAEIWKLFDSPGLVMWSQVGEEHDGKGQLSEVEISYPLPGSPFWSWLGKLIAKYPKIVATNTGIPELAGLKYMALPGDALKLSELIDLYTKKGSARLEQSKKVAVTNLNRLVKHSGAVTLEDLTIERLNAFRTFIESDPNLKAASSIKKIYRDIRTVIGFGLRVGQDDRQIRQAMDRCKVLWTSREENRVKPNPISRKNLHKLLSAAKKSNGKEHWTAWILLALNCGLKMKDIVQMEWDAIDLKGKTYCSIRSKTRIQRIPQAACLWDETLAALKALPRNGKYVFTSCHGTTFNRNGRGNGFAAFRDEVGVKREDGTKVCFDDFRDGAYGAACRLADNDKWARLLCGHKTEGLQDSYVLRSPQIVKPATDAVYRAYFR